MEKIFEAALRRFVEDLRKVRPEVNLRDNIWRFTVPTGSRRSKWHLLSVTEYEKRFYCTWPTERKDFELDAKGVLARGSGSMYDDERKKLLAVLRSIGAEVKAIQRNWLAHYKAKLRAVPSGLRYGMVPRAVLFELLKDMYRPDKLLGQSQTRKFVQMVQDNIRFEESEGHHASMTLGMYYKYCHIAYGANLSLHKEWLKPEMTGAEMYKSMADGRDEDLRKLSEESATAFEKWYEDRSGGGHPWEIYRGGNSTHVTLGVIKRPKGWSLYLEGSSLSRMTETARIALAFQKEGLPFELHEAEKMRLRFLGEDNVGIVPEFARGSAAYHDFAKEDLVYDCIAYSDLAAARRQILPFISWKPFAPLFPS